MKLVGRGDTTVVDAYLSPILRRYVDPVASEMGDTRLMFMQSNGGLTDDRLFQGKAAILSGPAGGIVGAVQTVAPAGFPKLIHLHMGKLAETSEGTEWLGTENSGGDANQ